MKQRHCVLANVRDRFLAAALVTAMHPKSDHGFEVSGELQPDLTTNIVMRNTTRRWNDSVCCNLQNRTGAFIDGWNACFAAIKQVINERSTPCPTSKPSPTPPAA